MKKVESYSHETPKKEVKIQKTTLKLRTGSLTKYYILNNIMSIS